ncbi:mucin-associated surface protein (MASP), partial [Trypanosoma cruzi]
MLVPLGLKVPVEILVVAVLLALVTVLVLLVIKIKILKKVKVPFPGHLPVVLLHLPSPIDGDASGNNGGALSTQDTTSLKNDEQSGPTTSSGNAPLNRETPERSTPDAQRHSSDTQENETSRLPDGDANYSAVGQSAVGTKGSSGVSTTASNAPTTPQPQLPAPPVPPKATVTGAPAEKPTAERLPPPADSTPGEGLATTTTAQTNGTATPGD